FFGIVSPTCAHVSRVLQLPKKNKPQRILTPTFLRANTNNPSSTVLAHTVRPHPLPFVALRTARRSPSLHAGALRTAPSRLSQNTQGPYVQHPGALRTTPRSPCGPTKRIYSEGRIPVKTGLLALASRGPKQAWWNKEKQAVALFRSQKPTKKNAAASTDCKSRAETGHSSRTW
ncbi:unnamed protein product, partial [Ectocarpus sp. 12 AP-2014]